MEKEMIKRMTTLTLMEDELLTQFLTHECNAFSIESHDSMHCPHYDEFKNAYLNASLM